MTVLLLSLIPPNALPLHLAPLRCQGRCSCTHVCTSVSGGKGVRGAKAGVVSAGMEMWDWADGRDSFHWEIAQR